MKILITDGMDRTALEALRNEGHEVVEQYFEPDALGAALGDFDAVVIRSKTKIRKAHIDGAKDGRLKLIIRGGVGVDNIDVDHARAAGLQVRNTPNASSWSVAEMAMALMFGCCRYVSVAGHTMREGKWEKKAYSKGMELGGKTLGIIGLGRIGQCMAKMARGIGMEVIAYNRTVRPQVASALGLTYVSLEELYAKADVISLHTPALGDKPLIDRAAIGQMKDGVVIVNTSRGSNIDEEALLEGLNSGKVWAAGLDVWAQEPSMNEALYCHPHVACAPHIAASTVEAQKKIGQEILTIIREFQG